MWRLRHGSIIATLGLVSLVAPAYAAAGGGLTIEVVPTSVAPELGKTVPVLVVVRNRGATAAPVKLSWVGAVPARVSLDALQPRLTLSELAKGADRAWQFEVAVPTAASPGKLLFRVDYFVGANHQVVIAPLDIQSGTPTKLDEIASVEIKTTLDSLEENDEDIVYAFVTNKLPTPLTVKRIVGERSDDVTIEPVGPVVVEPHRTRVIDVNVTTDGRVRPGKRLLVFDVHLAWGDPPEQQEAHLVATQQAQVGVFGESAILAALGVPSFLLVPGVLFLTGIAMLWRIPKLRPRGAGPTFPLTLKDTEFWALAFPLAIGFGLVYYAIAGVDYFRGAYSLSDIVYAWVISLVLGCVGYVIVWGFLFVRDKRRTPSVNDDQVAIIRKLSRLNQGLDRRRFQFGAASATYIGFLLHHPDGAAKAWLSPAVNIRVNDDAAGSQALLEALQSETDPGRLANLIKRRCDDLQVVWVTGGPPHAYEAELENEQESGRIVRTE